MSMCYILYSFVDFIHSNVFWMPFVNTAINEYLGKYVGVHRGVYAYFTYIHNVNCVRYRQSIIKSRERKANLCYIYFYLLSSHTLFVGHSCAFIDAVFYARHLRVDAH